MENKLPDWYWTKGLHDAQVTSVEVVELSYDYTQKSPRRNYLQLNIDAKQALFDTTIRAIRFYNYKCVNLDDLNDGYWVKDELSRHGEKFELKIDLTNMKGKSTSVSISFDDAEVIR